MHQLFRRLYRQLAMSDISVIIYYINRELCSIPPLLFDIETYCYVVVVVVVESPQAPEDDSQQRQRCAWEAHELIKGPPQAEALTLHDEGRASEPWMFRRFFFLRAESVVVRLRHSGHMLPASVNGDFVRSGI